MPPNRHPYRRVHPCRRREHFVSGLPPIFKIGSSLQAQGTPIGSARLIRSRRFIPAGAGNTTLNPVIDPHPAVHPCRRREHCLGFLILKSYSGSSLQAQGTRNRNTVIIKVHRFIPAGAGNTLKKYTIKSTSYKT